MSSSGGFKTEEALETLLLGVTHDDDGPGDGQPHHWHGEAAHCASTPTVARHPATRNWAAAQTKGVGETIWGWVKQEAVLRAYHLLRAPHHAASVV